MHKTIRNERGMGLMSVIIATGIMGILMMTLCDMMLLMTKNNTTAQANSDITGFVNQLRTNMQSPDRASQMLTGNSVEAGVPVVINDPMVSGQVLAQVGSKQSPNDAWKVKRISLENVVSNPNGLSRVTLVMVFEKDSTRTMGLNLTRRVIGDAYCFVNSNVITGCVGGTDPVAAARVQCRAMGGNWVEAESFGRQCGLATAAAAHEKNEEKKEDCDKNKESKNENR